MITNAESRAAVAGELGDPADRVFDDRGSARTDLPVQVHAERIATRAAPVRMTPSQALHLAEHGPRRKTG